MSLKARSATREHPQAEGHEQPEPPSPQRRRGQQLEEALLDAAWQELQHSGYEQLTLDAVARRASTSRAVLYRRWGNKAELIAAAMRQRLVKQRGPAPDTTGNLRDDLIRALTWTSRFDFQTHLTLGMQVSLQEGLSLSQLRGQMLSSSSSGLLDRIYQEAIERGELDAARLTPRLKSLPFDLLRHELILHQRPPSPEAIVDIVDDLVMPLMRDRRPATTKPTGGGRD